MVKFDCNGTFLTLVVCLFLFQADWKLVAMSASYRLKQPDRRFDELKNYATELQTHINNIIKIRMVPDSLQCQQEFILFIRKLTFLCKTSPIIHATEIFFKNLLSSYSETRFFVRN